MEHRRVRDADGIGRTGGPGWQERRRAGGGAPISAQSTTRERCRPGARIARWRSRGPCCSRSFVSLCAAVSFRYASSSSLCTCLLANAASLATSRSRSNSVTVLSNSHTVRWSLSSRTRDRRNSSSSPTYSSSCIRTPCPKIMSRTPTSFRAKIDGPNWADIVANTPNPVPINPPAPPDRPIRSCFLATC